LEFEVHCSDFIELVSKEWLWSSISNSLQILEETFSDIISIIKSMLGKLDVDCEQCNTVGPMVNVSADGVS